MTEIPLRAMSIMLPTDMYHWLRSEAFRQGTSMSRILAYALREYVEMVETERKPT